MVSESSRLADFPFYRQWITFFCISIACSVFFSASASSNQPPAEAIDASKVFSTMNFLTERETWAALAVLFFGLCMALIATRLLRARLLNGSDTIRFSALILIVTGTLFLVTAGYSAQQIAPALGLLGTVAGYLLGRSERDRCKATEKESANDEA